MRYVAAVLTVAASVMLGRYAVQRRMEEVKALEAVTLMFAQIKSMLGFACLPAGDILDKLCSDSGFSSLVFLKECKSRCDGGEAFPDAWENALKIRGRESGLSRENAQKLVGFGKNFGVTDLEGQLASCALYESMLHGELEKIRASAEKSSGLYVPLGFFAGLAVAIFIV